MSGSLVRYDAMLLAISEAKSIDEAKDIADKAEAMRYYARQARNREAEIDTAEIRIRAERRLGELLKAAKAEGSLTVGRPVENGHTDEPLSKATLKDFGIDKRLSSEAQQLAAVPTEKFEGDVAAWRERTEKESGRVTAKLVRQETKREERALREIVLAAEQRDLPDKRYGVILADPPWRFDPYSRETGMDRAADNHYPTMGVGEIAGLPVHDIAADDCVLFLWATIPMIEGALHVLKAWGFEYKSHAVWVKPRVGTGYWFRQKHELLLVGTRGKVPAPSPGTQMPSAIEAPVGEHSVKPDAFYSLIESYFPNLPKVELFARKARGGWDRWGNEAPQTDANYSENIPSTGGVASDSQETGAGNGLADGGRHSLDERANGESGRGNGSRGHAAGEEDRPEHPSVGSEMAPPPNGNGHHDAGASGGDGEPDIPLGLIRDSALREKERIRREAA